MPASSRAWALAVLLLASTVAAGCLGASDEDGASLNESANNDSLSNESASNATLPDGRGESAGLKETNKTEEGVGGVDHKHDYWKGKSMDVVHDDFVHMYTTPLYPDGEGSEAKAVAYVKLPPPKLVYEGAEKVVVTASQPMLFQYDWSGAPGAPHPTPPNLFLEYRSARDAEWQEAGALAYDQPLEISVNPQETDMPHSVQSLWVFRVTTDRAVVESFDIGAFSFHLLVTAHKGREVADWPGHPDFYADSDRRVVLDEHVTTYMSGIQEGIMYDSGGTWVAPSKLVSHGTERLDVWINVTDARNAYNAEPTGYFLEFHNATVIGPEERFGNRSAEETEVEPLVSYLYQIPVDHNGMDGPYQPASRWGFRAMATFADVRVPDGPGVGFCPGCFPYEIEYDITIVAWGRSTGDGM